MGDNGVVGSSKLRPTLPRKTMNEPAKPRSEQILRYAYDEAAVGLCYLDTDLRYLHINKWLAQLNGLPGEKHLGRTVHEVIPAQS